MKLISIIENFQPKCDARLLRRAEELTPSLLHDTVQPVSVRLLTLPDGDGDMVFSPERLPEYALRPGRRMILDFGTHMVGRFSLSLGYAGSHPDAPAFLSLRFAEVWHELWEDSGDYQGWLSKSWIQQEQLHVDVLPGEVTLPRRYAFRYVLITVEDTSPKYQLVVKKATCLTESAVRFSDVAPLHTGDAMLDKLDQVSLRTLANCMQKVFEDGPKRDRRLWTGDLRLQALTNYVSFQRNDLVKRCLYLFAASRFPDGRVSAALFTEPEPEADDTCLFDYSLFFVNALDEYLNHENDGETLNDLYPIAMEQLAYAVGQCGDDGILSPTATGSAFIDWAEGLDRQACAQGVLLCALDSGISLARRKGEDAQASELEGQRARLAAAARAKFWDEGRRCFSVDGQCAIATQVWMILSDVSTREEAADILSRPLEAWDSIPMVTPYMHHYYVAALLHAGLKQQALEHMKAYWGSMLDYGADTFWEAWNPDDPKGSPYNSTMVNSYCHAWSCTPAYLIRTYFA